MRRYLSLAIGAMLAIPVVGILVSSWILLDYNRGLPEGFTISLICQQTELLADADIQAACTEIGRIGALRLVSILAGALGLILIGVYFAAARYADADRDRNASIFPKLIPLSSFVIAILVLVHGALLTYSIYLAESYLLGTVHLFIIAGIGIGALIGGISLIKATLSLNEDPSHSEFAKSMSKQDTPKLWGFVESIADQLNANKPNNIIVGLQPTFYATAAEVKLPIEKRSLSGETLYLSLPLMRLFSQDELKAVIGHELGHFRGEDTAYTLKFAPVYRGLSGAMDSLGDGAQGGLYAVAKLPAMAMLSLMMNLFAVNERKISKIREHEADRAGLEAASKDALASALAKVAVYGPLWSHIQSQNIERLNNGKIAANLSEVYQDSARYDVAHEALPDLIEKILATKISHPTDTHPTIAERFDRIDFDSKALTVDSLTNLGNAGPELLDDILDWEKDLTLFEHRLMVAVGAVTPPEEERKEHAVMNVIYTLAAKMVCADGRIDQNEIAAAEGIGQQLFGNFDAVEFRSFCNQANDLPSFQEAVELLAPGLDQAQKDAVYDYLQRIAMADGEMADAEADLLAEVKRQWGVQD